MNKCSISKFDVWIIWVLTLKNYTFNNIMKDISIK